MVFVVEFICIFIGLILLLLIYIKRSQSYWAKKDVPYLESISFWGNMENPLRPKYGLKYDIKNAYDEFKKRGFVHGGIYFFTHSIYIPVDPKLIKNILSKDFQYFIGHGLPYDEKKDPLSAHLFNLDGDEWKNMRVRLTPTFTSGKMKMMFNTLLDCGGPLIDHIDKLCKNGESLDIKEILACYTTDIIGSCAFGLECNSFKNPDAEFRSYGRQVFTVSLRNKMSDLMRFAFPAIAKLIYIRSVSMDLENFFKNVVKGVLDYRVTNGVKRNDFMQIFLEMGKKSNENEKKGFTFEQIVAQAFIFFLGGFETSATTMTFCLHELAFNQNIQDKLREEVRETMKKYENKLTYDGIAEMKYLDQVINETLRKYPPAPFINRVCNKEYKIPNTNVTLDAGTNIFISSLGLHRDAEYYPNPEKFDPNRFTEEAKKTRPAFTFIPFGEGPRICLGLRFGLMQTKTGISMLLDNYRILPGKDEIYNFDFEPSTLILTKKGKVMLKAEKLIK